MTFLMPMAILGFCSCLLHTKHQDFQQDLPWLWLLDAPASHHASQKTYGVPQQPLVLRLLVSIFVVRRGPCKAQLLQPAVAFRCSITLLSRLLLMMTMLTSTSLTIPDQPHRSPDLYSLIHCDGLPGQASHQVMTP